MTNLLIIFFVGVLGLWSHSESSANILTQHLEDQLCELLPQLPPCVQSDETTTTTTQESVSQWADVNPFADVAQGNYTVLTMALDYIATTQQRNKELREQETQQEDQIATLERETEILQEEVRALEEEWLPTFNKNPRSLRRSLADIASSLSSSLNVSFPMNSYQPTANLLRPVDCSDHLVLGSRVSGVYEIYPFKCRCSEPVKVWCDMQTDGGGWTMILNRQNHSDPLNFGRTWIEYQKGFGSASAEYWIGNDNLHVMTNTRANTLRLDFQLMDGTFRWAEWPKFLVGDEANKYKLEVPQFNGYSMIDNCLSYHNGKYFSTYNYDNDGSSNNCALNHKNGWWHHNCAILDPMVPYNAEGHLDTTCTYTLNGKTANLQGPSLQLKMRPGICSQPIKAVHFNSHTCEGHNGQ